LLDEPVASLDVSVQAQILNLLSDIRATTGIAWVCVSHDLGVVRQICEEILVMQHGKVVEQGPADSILQTPREPYTRLLLDSIPRPGWKPVHSRRRTEATAFRAPGDRVNATSSAPSHARGPLR
jgi:ABC-type dipeptide/oligopeptide/nickel transport system ATPase component